MNLWFLISAGDMDKSTKAEIHKIVRCSDKPCYSSGCTYVGAAGAVTNVTMDYDGGEEC